MRASAKLSQPIDGDYVGAPLKPVVPAIQSARQAYEELREAILKGTFLPGYRLVEVDIAKHLGVSRTPVREALRTLEQAGLVCRLSSGGMAVRKIEPKEIIDVYECRAILEGWATRLACKSDDREALIERLEEIEHGREEAVRAGRIRDAFEFSSEFHLAILERASNDRLRELMDGLNTTVLLYRRWCLAHVERSPAALEAYHRALEASHTDHDSVIDDIRVGDVGRAEHCMREHNLHSGRNMEAIGRVILEGLNQG